jgi:predicted PurR-regulated permease PerM
VLLGVPSVLLGNSFATHVQSVAASAQDGALHVPPPAPSVAEWPIIGKKVYGVWNSAATNLPAFINENQDVLKDLSKKGLAAAASTAATVLLFLGAMIIAAIMMAYAEPGGRAMQRIFTRLTDPVRGPRILTLATATVRSVAAGVIGVAFIQAILLGMGFLLAGIPAAGVLALLVMVLGILQLPALLVSLPAVAWLWMSGDGSTTSNVAFTIYLLVAGAADNVLKPLLLGRGVDAPMPVILIGALGGMVAGGIIGLFIGGVVLAVGYQLFMEWVNDPDRTRGAEP